MRVADYLMNFLSDQGIRDVFTVSGGGIMYLTDSLGRHPHLRYICNYHEQACAIAAESYSRINGALGACLVTTGPGSTNALSGVAGAWVDSIPLIVISGQVRRDLIADYSKVRQLGPQEINIAAMARPITKYFTTIMDPTRIRYELEKAVSLAKGGRPGPVWINIPLDVQGAMIDASTLPGFERPGDDQPGRGIELARLADQVLQLLSKSRRPVIVPGHGIRLGHSEASFGQLVERLQIPVLPTTGSTDLIHETHPCFMGRFGPLGQRRANFTIQNADLILALGASLSLSTVGFNSDSFAPGATKVMVNIDQQEIAKARPAPDLGIAADVGEFIEQMLALPAPDWGTKLDRWWGACRYFRTGYPPVTSEYFADSEHVNSYVFANALSAVLGNDDVVLTGNSLDWCSIYQTFTVKQGQRVFTNVNFGSMGWDIPAAVGACVARNRRRTVLVTGDGTFQFNIHELQTIAHNQLVVKIFVLNNSGYASIRSTQETHFDGLLVGADVRSGVSNPSFQAIAAAYRFRYASIRNNEELEPAIRSVLDGEDPVLCEINIGRAQKRSPRIMSQRREDGTMDSGTLENMYPFLPPEEILRNMQISRTDDAVTRSAPTGASTA
jgi:acetolactate synthase I/II/III large subunit